MLGEGFYQLSEAARYAGVPAATVRSWFKRRSDDRGLGPVFTSDFSPIGADFAISFMNLIEVYVARFFKNEGVDSKSLRRTHEVLKAELGIAHPFAYAQLATDGKRILKTQGDAQMIDVITRQHFFGQMMLHKISYSPATKLAEAWGIADGVTINRGVAFGKPVIENTGIATYVVANQYKANKGNAALVASIFGLAESNVMQAVKFESSLRRVA